MQTRLWQRDQSVRYDHYFKERQQLVHECFSLSHCNLGVVLDKSTWQLQIGEWTTEVSATSIGEILIVRPSAGSLLIDDALNGALDCITNEGFFQSLSKNLEQFGGCTKGEEKRNERIFPLLMMVFFAESEWRGQAAVTRGPSDWFICPNGLFTPFPLAIMIFPVTRLRLHPTRLCPRSSPEFLRTVVLLR